jgi:hypothetical protein
MKKSSIFPYLKSLLLILFVLIINSCKKESEIKTIDEIKPEIKNAIRAFLYENQNNQKENSNSNEKSKSIRHQINKIPYWEKAVYQKVGGYNAVVVPIKFDNELYYNNKNRNVDYSLHNLSYLIIYKDINQNQIIEWVTILPDNLQSFNNNKNTFTGKVIVEDWNGNFKKAFLYKNNEIKMLNLINQEETKKVNSSAIGVNSFTCTYEPWFQYVYVVGDEENGTWSIGGYDFYCFSTGININNNIETIDYIAGGELGGGGDPDLNSDCYSWNFKTVGPNGYQACGVSKIDVDRFDAYIDANGIDWYVRESFEMPTVYFEMPGIYTAGQAASICAGFTDLAEKAYEDIYRNLPPLQQAAARLAFLNILKSYIEPIGGRVTLQPNYSNLPIRNLSKVAFGNGNCF